VGLSWGGRGSNPRPTDYESLDGDLRDQAKWLAETREIRCKAALLAVASTVPVRQRYGCKSPSDAGVTPG
jgi:hypothetical protein